MSNLDQKPLLITRNFLVKTLIEQEPIFKVVNLAPPSPNQRPSFHAGTGYVKTDLGSKERANAVVVQPDGKLLVAGSIERGLTGSYILLRYNSDGSLDTSFNGLGYTVLLETFAGMGDECRIFLQADGSIVVGGAQLIKVKADGKIDYGFSSLYAPNQMVVYDVDLLEGGKFFLSGFREDKLSGAYKFNSVASRLNANGTVDTSFNKSLGLLEFNFGSVDFFQATHVLANQKILALASVDIKTKLIQMNTDGSLDLSFGRDGIVDFTIGSIAIPYAVTTQRDGKILIAGKSGDDAFVARFNADGKLDTSFNGIGYALLGFSMGSKATQLRVQDDGKILVAGTQGFSPEHFAVARLNPNGSLDSSFSGDGRLFLTDGVTQATGIEVQKDGKILFTAANDQDVVLVRVNQDGSMDRTFKPMNSVDASVRFTYTSGAVVLDSDAQVYDADFALTNNYAGSSLILERVGGANAQDIFVSSGTLIFDNQRVKVNNVDIGSIELIGGRLQIKFSNLATRELVNACMQQISYKNSNLHKDQSIAINWLFDDGSGASNSSVSSSTTVKVIAVPNRSVPTTSDRLLSTMEDEIYTLKPSDFTFIDMDWSDSLQGIVIAGLPSAGTLFLKGRNGAPDRAIEKIEFIDVNDISAGRLYYKSVANTYGKSVASFQIRVSDGVDISDVATIRINISPVNDVPQGSVAIGGSFTVGQTLVATNTLTDIDGLGAISYQWSADGVAMAGENSSNLILGQTHFGKIISVQANYLDAAGSQEKVNSLVAKSVGGKFVGSEEDDEFISQSGDEEFNGGDGIDTVVYLGYAADYVIKKNGQEYTLRSKLNSDGVDVLKNIERVQFADLKLDLSIQSRAAASNPEEINQIIELYISFFNRVPDASGLSYWIGEYQSGKTLSQIAETFYQVGVQYPELTGFSSTMSDADFINSIYRNTLGRSSGADAAGLSYWKGELAAGRVTHGSLVASILNSAHSFKGDHLWGFVADLLDNKVAVGRMIAIDFGVSFNSDAESIYKGMAIAAAVTPTSYSVALDLIGIHPNDFELL